MNINTSKAITITLLPTPEGRNIAIKEELDRQARPSSNRHNRNESESSFSSDSDDNCCCFKKSKRKKTGITETRNPPQSSKTMFLTKLVSWIRFPWTKKSKKPNHTDVENGGKTTVEVNNNNNEKKKKKGWKYWLTIILLIVLIANVIALNVKVGSLKSPPESVKNVTTVVDGQEQDVKSIVCMTLYGSNSFILRDFPCDFCLGYGPSFYNVTEFCILKNFWLNAANQTVFEKLRWLSSNNYCDWAGVTCNENGNVVELEFLHPFVPNAFTFRMDRMTTLRKLTITGDGAFPRGRLPNVIFKMENLVELNIVSTGYIGPFPNNIINNMTQLVSLKSLHISNNTQLNGTIPNVFSYMKELKELNLTNNQLSGPVPDSLATIDLDRLSLGGNLLNGTVPDSVCQKEYLGCSLGRNQFPPQSCGLCTFT